MSDFLFIAHRGASGCWPENTLLAFRQALDAGAKWLELDVHLSADGELVVIHDETLQRTTNGKGRVGDFSYAELLELDAGQGETIPLLEEVLALAQGRAGVNIELKGAQTGAAVARLLEQHFAARKRLPKLLASSLYEKELRVLAARLPSLPLALVADRVEGSIWQLADELNLWSLNLDKSCIDQALVAEAKKRRRKLLVFTVNEVEEVELLRNWGVDGVFTDFPERFNPGENGFFAKE